MLDQVNIRFVFVFLLASAFGACGYDAPSASEIVASSTSSSGAGGMGGAQPSSSSSSGTNGDGGGLTSSSGIAGAGGFFPDAGTVGSGGAGGIGEMTSTSSSSSSSGMGGSGTPSDPIVSNCEVAECHTSPAFTICCKGKTAQDSNNCTAASGVCVLPSQYAMECDDISDCAMGLVCCMQSDRAECKSGCSGMVVCKTNADCPMDQACIIPGGTIMFCGQK